MPVCTTAAPSSTDHDPTDRDGLSIDDAAAALRITPNAVRQRMKRGTLHARKTAASWRVWLPTDHDDHAPADRPTTNQPRPTGRTRPTDQTDLAPLADLIARLSRENAELAASSAMWQERTRTLAARLPALEPGPLPPDDDTTAQTPKPRPWYRRLFNV